MLKRLQLKRTRSCTNPILFLHFVDVISIEKTGENFRLVYDVKGRFTIHRISPEEAAVSINSTKDHAVQIKVLRLEWPMYIYKLFYLPYV